jgi:5-methylcytosine-specific restriction enzyme A
LKATLYCIADRLIRRYWVNWTPPTYATGDLSTGVTEALKILPQSINYLDQDYQQYRLIVLRRDNYMCQHYGKSEKRLYVHHIIPKEHGGTNDLDNLTTLCIDCHQKAHQFCDCGSLALLFNADGKPCARKLAHTVWEAA